MADFLLAVAVSETPQISSPASSWSLHAWHSLSAHGKPQRAGKSGPVQGCRSAIEGRIEGRLGAKRGRQRGVVREVGIGPLGTRCRGRVEGAADRALEAPRRSGAGSAAMHCASDADLAPGPGPHAISCGGVQGPRKALRRGLGTRVRGEG